MNNKFTNEEQAQWLQVGAAHGEEFLGELRGVAQAVNMTNDMNLLLDCYLVQDLLICLFETGEMFRFRFCRGLT